MSARWAIGAVLAVALACSFSPAQDVTVGDDVTVTDERDAVEPSTVATGGEPVAAPRFAEPLLRAGREAVADVFRPPV